MYSNRCLSLAVLLTALLFCLPSAGQSLSYGFSAGLYNSPKGLGLIAEFAGSEGGFQSLRLDADLHGLLSGKYDRPGVMFNYSANRIISASSRPEYDLFFYMGPGVSAGYVKDFDLDNNPGGVLAISGSLGWIIRYHGGISLDVSWTLDAGVHLRQSESGDGSRLSFYKNGVIRFPYPQVSIVKQF